MKKKLSNVEYKFNQIQPNNIFFYQNYQLKFNSSSIKFGLNSPVILKQKIKKKIAQICILFIKKKK